MRIPVQALAACFGQAMRSDWPDFLLRSCLIAACLAIGAFPTKAEAIESRLATRNGLRMFETEVDHRVDGVAA